MKKRRRIPLQLKVTVGLLIVVLVPLVLSAYLIDSIGKASANVAAGEAAERVDTMEHGLDAYRELFDTTKRLHAEIADRLAKRPDLVALDPKASLDKILDDDSAKEAGLHGLALERADGTIVSQAVRALPTAAPGQEPQWRDKVVRQPLAETGATLVLTFEVPAGLQRDFQNLKHAIDSARLTMQIRTGLPDTFRDAFLKLMGIGALLATAFGLVISTFYTRRLARLVTAARAVSAGQIDARSGLRGSDETAEVGEAFDNMLDDLRGSRDQVAYLQRIGAWQDVARRLAHEIKNPLTPIQLAVQQCVSAYKGADTDPARFGKLLADTGEIVEEEILSLRRLVDTFRTLGQLPKVEKAPLALGEVLEELRNDPLFAAKLELDPPEAPVTVRADKLLLKRVVANLVENGIHAGDDANATGKVVVGWRADGDSIVITVDDRGKGVAEADRERIFEPYVTTKSTGTGLGLAIARKIAIEHGGDLAVAAKRAPTGGARFVITLPVAD